MVHFVAAGLAQNVRNLVHRSLRAGKSPRFRGELHRPILRRPLLCHRRRTFCPERRNGTPAQKQTDRNAFGRSGKMPCDRPRRLAVDLHETARTSSRYGGRRNHRVRLGSSVPRGCGTFRRHGCSGGERRHCVHQGRHNHAMARRKRRL